jgi:uncharacterized integral membrane protein
MKTIVNLITAAIVATWVAAIAVLSVQNATPVSLQFLMWRSIQMPVGVVLAFSAAVGVLGGAIAQTLFLGSAPAIDSSEEEEP